MNSEKQQDSEHKCHIRNILIQYKVPFKAVEHRQQNLPK